MSRSATEIQALKVEVEVEVEGEVQPSWNGMQWWCANGVQWRWVALGGGKVEEEG